MGRHSDNSDSLTPTVDRGRHGRHPSTVPPGTVASKTLILGGGYHDETAFYLGDTHHAASTSGEAGVTVNPATTSVAYGRCVLGLCRQPARPKATVACAGGVADRTVTFIFTPAGDGTPTVVTATTDSSDLVTADAAGLTGGEYE